MSVAVSFQFSSRRLQPASVRHSLFVNDSRLTLTETLKTLWSFEKHLQRRGALSLALYKLS